MGEVGGGPVEACIACGMAIGVIVAWVCAEVERRLSHGGNWILLELKHWFVCMTKVLMWYVSCNV